MKKWEIILKDINIALENIELFCVKTNKFYTSLVANISSLRLKAEEDFVQYSTVQKSEQSRAHMYEYQGIVLKHVGRFSLQSYHSKNKVKCVQYMGVKGEKRGFFVDNMEGYWAGTFYMLHVKVLRRTRNMFWSACYMICDAYYMLHATRCMLRVTLYMFHVTCYMLHATCYMLLHGTPYMMDVTCYMLQYMCLQT